MLSSSSFIDFIFFSHIIIILFMNPLPQPLRNGGVLIKVYIPRNTVSGIRLPFANSCLIRRSCEEVSLEKVEKSKFRGGSRHFTREIR